MKSHKVLLPILTLTSLALTQCEVPLDENGNVPSTYGEPVVSAPASDYVPAKVKADCMAKLSGMVGGKPMKVISAVKGENSYIVDIQVEGVPNLWRCYHDGTQCTGTEYQGEG